MWENTTLWPVDRGSSWGHPSQAHAGAGNVIVFAALRGRLGASLGRVFRRFPGGPFGRARAVLPLRPWQRVVSTMAGKRTLRVTWRQQCFGAPGSRSCMSWLPSRWSCFSVLVGVGGGVLARRAGLAFRSRRRLTRGLCARGAPCWRRGASSAVVICGAGAFRPAAAVTFPFGLRGKSAREPGGGLFPALVACDACPSLAVHSWNHMCQRSCMCSLVAISALACVCLLLRRSVPLCVLARDLRRALRCSLHSKPNSSPLFVCSSVLMGARLGQMR